MLYFSFKFCLIKQLNFNWYDNKSLYIVLLLVIKIYNTRSNNYFDDHLKMKSLPKVVILYNHLHFFNLGSILNCIISYFQKIVEISWRKSWGADTRERLRRKLSVLRLGETWRPLPQPERKVRRLHFCAFFRVLSFSFAYLNFLLRILIKFSFACFIMFCYSSTYSGLRCSVFKSRIQTIVNIGFTI